MKLTDIEYDFNVDKLSVLQNHRILKYQKKKKKITFLVLSSPFLSGVTIIERDL